MSQVGFYYWRGRPLRLCRDSAGRYFVKGLPNWLRDDWRRDVKRGRIRMENP